MLIFTRAWWSAAGARALSTALAVLIPLAGVLIAGGVPVARATSMVAVVALVSLLTSLAGLPEVTGTTTAWWRAILVRCAKTLGQAGATALVGVELLEAVDWRAAYVVVGGAVAVTLIRTALAYLPETDQVIMGEVRADLSAAGNDYTLEPYIPRHKVS